MPDPQPDPQGDTPPPPPPDLRFLRVLVTTLTAVLILGIIAIVTLLFIRLSSPAPRVALELPETVTLPEGTTATAVTLTGDHVVVVTDTDAVLFFDRESGALRHSLTVE